MHWTNVVPVNDAVRELLATDAVTLRCLHAERREGGRGVLAYELAVTKEPQPEAAWLTREELAGIEDPDQRAVLERWLGEPDDELRVPWAEPGWQSDAATWIAAQLESSGRRPTGPAEQFTTSSISSVLRTPTDGGDVYFKAVPPLFAQEPVLTPALERRHGRRIVSVLAADEERRWLLTADHGGGELDVADVAACARVFRSYAEIQLEWTGEEAALRALGCPDRGLDALEAEIEPTLADDYVVRPLSSDERARLPALARRLRAACERLRGYEIPLTIEHGDLHARNLAVGADGPVFFDWTDGCVSLPFFSLVPFLDYDEPAEADTIRDAYLEPWERELARDGLVDAFELAQELGRLHQAVSYRRIVEATEPGQQWQFGPAAPAFVRQLLEAG